VVRPKLLPSEWILLLTCLGIFAAGVDIATSRMRGPKQTAAAPEAQPAPATMDDAIPLQLAGEAIRKHFANQHVFRLVIGSSIGRGRCVNSENGGQVWPIDGTIVVDRDGIRTAYYVICDVAYRRRERGDTWKAGDVIADMEPFNARMQRFYDLLPLDYDELSRKSRHAIEEAFSTDDWAQVVSLIAQHEEEKAGR
jgi:hypothetical protein